MSASGNVYLYSRTFDTCWQFCFDWRSGHIYLSPFCVVCCCKTYCRLARERQKQKNVSIKRPTKRDSDTGSLEQAVAVPTLAPCVTIAFISSGNRWPPLEKRSVKLSSLPAASQSTFANRVLLRQTLYNLSQLSGTFTNGAQLTPSLFPNVDKVFAG